MKEYIKPVLEVREIRVSENLANNVDWSYNKESGSVTLHTGLLALVDNGSDVASF